MAKTNPPPGGGHSLHPGYLRRRGDPRRGGIEGGGVNRSCIGVTSELHRSYIGVTSELDRSCIMLYLCTEISSRTISYVL